MESFVNLEMDAVLFVNELHNNPDVTVQLLFMNLHPHAVLNRVLWRWYQSPFGL